MLWKELLFVGHQPQSLKTLKINYVHLHHEKENEQDEFAIAVYRNEFGSVFLFLFCRTEIR